MLEKICELLEGRGYTQEGFERAMGLPKGRLTKWKSKTGEPSARQLHRMSRALGVSMEYLVDDDERESPSIADVTADVTADERYVLRVMRSIGLDADTAVQRLAQPPAVKPIGPTYADLKESRRKRRNGDEEA